jgi:hypothetical protein
MITKGFTFAELNKEQKDLVHSMEIGATFISAEDCEKVTKVLELDGKTSDELTAIMNSVVAEISETSSVQEWINMSGIAAIIDNKIWSLR